MQSEKGATRIDKAAHSLMEFDVRGLNGCARMYHYTAFYHEDGLYSVRNEGTGIVSLVYAKSPYDAINRTMSEYERDVMRARLSKPTRPNLPDSGTYLKCPCCEMYINANNELPHCPRCGQKLDWSGEDGRST